MEILYARTNAVDSICRNFFLGMFRIIDRERWTVCCCGYGMFSQQRERESITDDKLIKQK